MRNPLRVFFENRPRLTELDSALTAAFEKVKAERVLVFSWVNHLRKKDAAHEHFHQRVTFQLGRHEAEIIDLQRQLKELQEKLSLLSVSPFPNQTSPFPNQVRTWSEPESEPKSEPISGPVSGPDSKSRFVNKIVSMIRPQRKEYVMQKILDLAEEGEHTTKEIETMIVKEKGLCGRTAFYDYLKELKHKGILKSGLKNGKKVVKTN